MIKSFPFLTVSVTVFILAAVLFPGPALPDLPESWIGVDKIVHFLMFVCLAAALHADFRIIHPRNILVACVAGIGFSLITEILQLFADGRSFDLFDGLFDVSGFIFGMVFRNRLARPLYRIAGNRVNG